MIVTRLASAYQVPITESLIKAWLDALEVVDDLQLAHSIHQMFLRSEIARHPKKKGWMPTPEELRLLRDSVPGGYLYIREYFTKDIFRNRKHIEHVTMAYLPR